MSGKVSGVVGVYRDAFSGIPRTIWFLAGANLVNRAGGMVLPFLTLYFTTQLGFSALEAGRTLSLYGVGSIVGAMLGGWMSDRVPSLWVQRASLLATGTGFLVLSQLRGRLAVSVAVFLLSLVTDCFRPALMISVTRSCLPEALPRSLSLLRLANNLGFAVGPAIGGFLATRHYGLLFVCDALTCWAAAAVLFALRLDVGAASAAPSRSETRKGRSPWVDGPFLGFLALTTLLAMVFFQIFATMPLYLKEVYHLSEQGIGMLLSLNGLSIALFEMVIVRALESRDRLRVAGVGCVLICLGFGLLPFGTTWVFAAFTFLVWTAGEMVAMPMINAAAAQRAPESRSGSYLGAYSVAFSAGWVAGPSVGMAIYSGFGGTVLWLAAGAMAVPLGLGFAGLSRRFRAPRPVNG
jgi:predicted MFS family arabinose efflux permease